MLVLTLNTLSIIIIRTPYYTREIINLHKELNKTKKKNIKGCKNNSSKEDSKKQTEYDKLVQEYNNVLADNKGLTNDLELSLKNSIGIDLGVVNTITTSDNKLYHCPIITKEEEKELLHYQRKISRQEKGSKRREKTKLKLRKAYKRIS